MDGLAFQISSSVLFKGYMKDAVLNIIHAWIKDDCVVGKDITVGRLGCVKSAASRSITYSKIHFIKCPWCIDFKERQWRKKKPEIQA